MKPNFNFFHVLCCGLVCLTLWCCVREVTRAWAAVELIKLGLLKPNSAPTPTRKP